MVTLKLYYDELNKYRVHARASGMKRAVRLGRITTFDVLATEQEVLACLQKCSTHEELVEAFASFRTSAASKPRAPATRRAATPRGAATPRVVVASPPTERTEARGTHHTKGHDSAARASECAWQRTLERELEAERAAERAEEDAERAERAREEDAERAERAREEAERTREAEVCAALAKRKFEQPFRSACELYHAQAALPADRQAGMYWLDADGGFYKCDGGDPYAAALATKKPKKAERPFEWVWKTVERKFTYADDPESLAPGETEWREVRECVRRYM